MPEVKYSRDIENGKDTFFLDSCFAEKIVFDLNSVSSEQRNKDHTGARLLCAASLSCFCNTFFNALKREGVDAQFINASASTEKEQDASLRTHYSELNIEVEVGLPEKDREIFEKVKNEMMNGSLLTYTLEEALEVDYELEMVAVD